MGRSRKRCCWNSLKVAVQFSVQQLHWKSVVAEDGNRERLRSVHMISKRDLNDAEMDTFDEILQSYDSHNRQWRSADA